MNAYVPILLKIAEDHLSESDRLYVSEKLGCKMPAPQAMNPEERLREQFKESILNRKKKR